MRAPDFAQRVRYQTFGERPLELVTKEADRRMWKLNLPPAGQRARPDLDATLAAWLLDCPGAHPHWQWYYVGVIHLRPIPGVRPADIRREGATHEVFVAALLPHDAAQTDAQRESVRVLCNEAGEYMPEAVETVACRDDVAMPLLSPVDVVQQVRASSDQLAEHVTFMCVRACCLGQLSPDQDYRWLWNRMLDETIQHYEEGKHAIG